MSRKIKLSSGYEIPQIGFGTWKLKDELPLVLDTAYKHGNRHIDTAARYDNEEIIGKWLAERKVRNEIFLTTKLWNDFHDCVEKACDESMKRLGVDYLDLYLVHFPINSKGELDIVKLWRDMEMLVEKKKVRSIGCSNFGIKNLTRILEICKIKPAVLQIELHVYLQQEELRSFCKKHDITVISYCSLGSNSDPTKKSVKDDPVIKAIAQKHGVHPCTILLSFCTMIGCCIIPRSSNPDHVISNMVTIQLDNDDMEKIKKLDRNIRYNIIDSFGPHQFD